MAEMETLTCKEGHTWKRKKAPGKKPLWCPDHRPQPTSAPMSKEERLERMQEGRKKKQQEREEEGASKLGRIIDEELAHPRIPACRCGLHNQMTFAEVMALGSGCTAGRWVCPTLDAVRRQMGH